MRDIINNLSTPPEPRNLKKEAQGRSIGVDWAIDSLIVWFGNRLPSYFWTEHNWKHILKKEGYQWQTFQKAVSLCKREILDWIHDQIHWEVFVERLKETLRRPYITRRSKNP